MVRETDAAKKKNCILNALPVDFTSALKVALANQQTVVYLHIQTRSNMFMYLESCFCPNDSFKYYIHLIFGSATVKKISVSRAKPSC